MATFLNTVGPQTITGTSGDDDFRPDFYKIYFENGTLDDDTISMGAGFDYGWLTPGADKIDGGSGFNTIEILLTINTVDQTEAAYNISPDASNKYVIDSSIFNTAAGTYEITYRLKDPVPFVTPKLTFTGTLKNFDSFLGGIGDNTFIGSAGGEYLSYFKDFCEFFRPGAGNDVIKGGAGWDLLAYEYSNDEVLPSDTLDPDYYVVRTQGITVNYASKTVLDGVGGTDTFSGIERILGTRFGDTFNGSGADETMCGDVGGADKFNGSGGTDTVYFIPYEQFGQPTVGVTADLTLGTGSGGNGQTFTFTSIEKLEGTFVADKLTGSKNADTFLSFDGDDTLSGKGGDDTLWGGYGKDTISGGTGNDTLKGEEGDDVIKGDSGKDKITGGNGKDTINGGDDYDLISGGAGNDTIYGDAEEDVVLGGDGNDTLRGGDNASAISADCLSGEAGDDKLYGDSGRDILLGGAGADQLNGGSGDDFLIGDSGQKITEIINSGQADRDYIFKVETVSAGNDVLDGGSGFDFADYILSTAAINASLLAGKSTGEGSDTLVNIEGLTGSKFNDTLTGDNADNVLIGGKGNDTLKGLGGNDVIVGNAGVDIIDGGTGTDTLIFDSVVKLALQAEKISANVYRFKTILGTTGEAVGETYISIEKFEGSKGNDDVKLIGDAPLKIEGGAGDDKITGGGGNDEIKGESGRDLLIGGAGDDALFGGSSADTLKGEAGNDRLDGGTGSDILSGGTGKDQFIFASPLASTNIDTITDFADGDKILLNNTLFKGTGAIGQAMLSDAFHLGTTAADKEDRILYDKAKGDLYYDADGKGGVSAVLFARVNDLTPLDSGDFFTF
jgi:Ca2+-binding RTX toxin-like protein